MTSFPIPISPVLIRAIWRALFQALTSTAIRALLQALVTAPLPALLKALV
jgi:hypothetical protein